MGGMALRDGCAPWSATTHSSSEVCRACGAFHSEAALWIDRPSTSAMQHGRETPSEKEESPSFLPKDWATPRIGRLRSARVSAGEMERTRHNWGLSGSLVLGR